MYKLVAIDLDGTLLNKYGEVTENTKNTIKKIIDEGIEIVIASGRPIDSIKAIAKEIGCKSYFIAGNGALIYDIQKDEIIFEKYMSKKKILELIELCEKNNVNYNVYMESTILAKALKYNVLYYYKENLKKEESKKTSIHLVNDIYEYIKKENEGKFLKMTVCDENQIIFKNILKKLRKIKGIEVQDITHMSRKTIRQGTKEYNIEYYCTEISKKNVDKWNAIEYLTNKLNIKKEEVIAIGDNVNDKKMIEEAGLGIAMKGSTKVITNVANEIADTNDNEGVSKMLQKYYNNINF